MSPIYWLILVWFAIIAGFIAGAMWSTAPRGDV